jgi:hypothetical protein
VISQPAKWSYSAREYYPKYFKVNQIDNETLQLKHSVEKTLKIPTQGVWEQPVTD